MGKAAVVTGGTAGIGLATAERFAAAGYDVAILARDADRVAEVVERLKKFEVRVLGISVDVADEAAMQRATQTIREAFGTVDVWVNNAMATVLAPFGEVSHDEWRRVTEVTYYGQVLGTHAALALMKTRRRPVIVQVNSGLSFRPIPLQSAYAAAKAACVAFTDALRSELVHEKSRVQLVTVYLPAVNTPQFDGWARNKMGKRQTAPADFHDPRQCAEAIFSASRRPRRDVYVGRSTLMMAVLQRLWPGGADRKAASAWDGQLSSTDQPYLEGNLFAPAPGPARIDGPYSQDMLPYSRRFFTSTHRHAGLLALGALATWLAVRASQARR